MEVGMVPIITRSETTYVFFNEILFIERDKRVTLIHTLEQVYRISSTMDDILALLDDRFFRSHYSMIVNFHNIKNMREGQIIFSDGTVIPLGRKSYLSTKKAFIAYLKGIALKQRKDKKNRE